jgi:hypothetical protein
MLRRSSTPFSKWWKKLLCCSVFQITRFSPLETAMQFKKRLTPVRYSSCWIPPLIGFVLQTVDGFSLNTFVTVSVLHTLPCATSWTNPIPTMLRSSTISRGDSGRRLSQENIFSRLSNLVRIWLEISLLEDYFELTNTCRSVCCMSTSRWSIIQRPAKLLNWCSFPFYFAFCFLFDPFHQAHALLPAFTNHSTIVRQRSLRYNQKERSRQTWATGLWSVPYL